MRILLFLILTISANIATGLEIYAHRGGRAAAPENTLPAYKHALAVGVDFVDMDVQMTKDGVVVVAHDYTLNPEYTKYKGKKWITNEPILIKSLTLKQLKKYTVGEKKPGTLYAKMFAHQKEVKQCTMPTLREVVQYVKKISGNQVGFQIEIKTDPQHPEWTFSPKVLAQAVSTLIHEMQIVPITEVQAFDYRVLQAIQRIDPKIKTAYLTQYDSKRNMLNPDPKIAGLWTGGYLLKNYQNSIPYMILKLGGDLWDPQDVEITKKIVAEAHKYKLKVVTWNWPHSADEVFQAKVINKLIDDKVDGIITDDPEKLRVIMRARGMKLPSQYPS